MLSSVTAIPRFALYGELSNDSDPGFVHIETIHDRSSLNNWEISPHRHDRLYQLLLIRRGRATVMMDGIDQTVDGPVAVIVPPGTVHGFRFAPVIIGDVVTVSADFIRLIDRQDDGGAWLAFAQRARVIAIDDARMQRIATLASEIRAAVAERAVGHAPLTMALAQAMLILIGQGVATVVPVPTAHDDRAVRLRVLVERHFREQRPVVFYADMLGMTERTLSRLCLRRFGCSPSTLLHQRLVLEARRLLRYSPATIAQIGAALGFDDPSYFSRFYQRMTGRRPATDRHQDKRDTLSGPE